jgi:hypothetical protein
MLRARMIPLDRGWDRGSQCGRGRHRRADKHDRRTLIERVDLSPCFDVAEVGAGGAAGWVVRCRKCSAGWLPNRRAFGGAATYLVDVLIEHAARHKIRLKRKARPPLAGRERSVIRTIVVTLDGRVIKQSRQLITRQLALAECEPLVQKLERRKHRQGEKMIDVHITYALHPPCEPAASAAKARSIEQR